MSIRIQMARNKYRNEIPGPELLKAMQEGLDILSGKKKTKLYSSAEELTSDILKNR
ncbi:MAG: hypothetical protein LBL60_00825 [Mycoplasmataceae bacterium]|jgi:hypothetical protein|nr:hypothetical protein [Mycoplasmataceae bacterium]